MDRRFALLIVGVTLFVIIFLVGCVSPSPTPTPTPTPSPPCQSPKVDGNTFTFSPSQGCVNSNVVIVAPNQGKDELEITALRLPTEPIPTPPPQKNITLLVPNVIEPRVRIKGTITDVITFQPPLTVTMEFAFKELPKNVPLADGKPKWSIISYYKDGNTWRWEKLDTTVVCSNPSCTAGTLKSLIYTLQPKDAEGEGY